MRLVRIQQLDCFNFGQSFRPGTKGEYRVVRFKGTVPYIGSSPSTDELYICTNYDWVGVSRVNLYSGAGQHDCVARGSEALEFNAICQSVTNHPAIYHERHIHRPRP
jgi:hypothetical protein